MNEKLIINGWQQKTVRISDDYNKICDFLELYYKKKGQDPRKVFDEVFNYSLDMLYKEGFHYIIIPYDKRREPKGFLLKEKTKNDLKENFDIYNKLYRKKENKKLLFAEFIELLMFIYCDKKLEKEDYEYINKGINWGINDVNK